MLIHRFARRVKESGRTVDLDGAVKIGAFIVVTMAPAMVAATATAMGMAGKMRCTAIPSATPANMIGKM